MKTTVILVLFGLLLTSCASQGQRKSFVESTPATTNGSQYVENGMANK